MISDDCINTQSTNGRKGSKKMIKAIKSQGPIKPGSKMAEVFMSLWEPRTIDEICDRVWAERSKYTVQNARAVMSELRARGYQIKRSRPKPRTPWRYELVDPDIPEEFGVAA